MTLIGADKETVLRWLILVVALLLDPAAVLRRPGHSTWSIDTPEAQDGCARGP